MCHSCVCLSTPLNYFKGSHTPQMSVGQSEVETQEAGPSHSTYIVPITIETNTISALDAARQETTNEDTAR